LPFGAMKKIAVFVDAGYFWVQLCNALTGSYETRRQVKVDWQALRERMLAEIKEQFPDGDLLRVYWYDGPGDGGKTAEHRAIDDLDDFKLRLGTRNGAGQQKGVDGLMIADLISLTQQNAITHALLVSGDADTAPGVIAAQSMGLRVHLLSVGSAAATSPYLAAEVDSKRSWGATQVAEFATRAAIAIRAAEPIAVPASGSAEASAPVKSAPMSFKEVAEYAVSHLSSRPEASQFAVIANLSSGVPSEIDRALLGIAKSKLGYVLDDDQKRDLRRHFKQSVLDSRAAALPKA
jgi:uncharacterized LabA/DUF88 family protein